MIEPQKDNKTATIFGITRSRKELLINGIVFLLINTGFFFFNLYSQLPDGFRDNPELLEAMEYQPPSVIVTIFLTLFGYILIDRGLFGSDVKALVEKHGVTGYFLRKIFLMFAIIFVNLGLQVISLLFIL